jgi:all-trans-retinol dehydrogenase (NAD+)
MIKDATGSDENVIHITCDVSDINSIKESGRIAKDKFGPVTLLINNAGIVSGKPILELSDFMIKKTIEVNTIAHLYTIREFLPDMIKLNKGHIVSISSIAGVVGLTKGSDYSASKFGAFAVDECLRLEMKKNNYNIKTTCICPYYINTGMFDGVKSNFFMPILD